MAFNPLQESGIPFDRQFRNWSELNVAPYDTLEVDPYTRTRVITLNGIETESIFFSHQFARHTTSPEIRKYLALTRRIEQQQQKAVNWLIPGNETTLEVTLGFEQVAVDLTAFLARTEPDAYIKSVLDFGLLEDFDHLYRYANLLDMLEGKKAERVVGNLTEVMPGRPTVEEHRHPFDDLRTQTDSTRANPLSMLHILTITAAEQQTMNFYMTIGNRPMEPLARGLYLEIAQIEEQHVTQYESLMDPMTSWLQQEVLHQYNECYLYYSFMVQETHPRIRALWELHLNMELTHLHSAIELLRKYEKRDPEEFLPAELPEPVRFEPNKEYVRNVLAATVELTSKDETFVPTDTLLEDDIYYEFNRTVNQGMVPSEEVITENLRRSGQEYRLQTEGPHPVARLQEMTDEKGRELEDRHEIGIADAGGAVNVDLESRQVG